MQLLICYTYIWNQYLNSAVHPYICFLLDAIQFGNPSLTLYDRAFLGNLIYNSFSTNSKTIVFNSENVILHTPINELVKDIDDKQYSILPDEEFVTRLRDASVKPLIRMYGSGVLGVRPVIIEKDVKMNNAMDLNAAIAVLDEGKNEPEFLSFLKVSYIMRFFMF